MRQHIRIPQSVVNVTLKYQSMLFSRGKFMSLHCWNSSKSDHYLNHLYSWETKSLICLNSKTIQWVLQPNTPALSCGMDRKLWNSKQIRLMMVKSVILVQNEKCMYMVWCHQFQGATALSAKKDWLETCLMFLKPIKKHYHSIKSVGMIEQ